MNKEIMFEKLFHENGGHFPKTLLYFLNEEDGEFTKLCQTNRSMIHIVRKLLLGSMHQIPWCTLNLFNNDITQLIQHPYSNRLKKLHIRCLSNITPLQGLVNLKHCYLQNNQIVNVEPLQALVNLTELYLVDNKIVNIEPLRGLVNLKNLPLGQ